MPRTGTRARSKVLGPCAGGEEVRHRGELSPRRSDAPRAAPRLPRAQPEGVRTPELTRGSQAPKHGLLSRWFERCAGLTVPPGDLVELCAHRQGLRGRSRGAASPAGSDPLSRGMLARAGSEEPPSDPTESSSPLCVVRRNQGLRRQLRRAWGTSGPESGEAVAPESQAPGAPAASLLNGVESARPQPR